jgi:hypothetical protein
MKHLEIRFDGETAIRFWSRVVTTPHCWLWTGSQRNGYGSMTIDGQNVFVHRLSWTVNRGPVPNGLCVLHKCDVRNCVNPDHLFLGTYKDNAQDASRKGRQKNQNSGKTHCKHGHALTAGNTYISIRQGKPHRACRTCVLTRGALRDRHAEYLRFKQRKEHNGR